MSDLISRVKEASVARKELVPTTVRIPKELLSFIEELSEHLGASKQDVMLDLLKERAIEVKKALDDEEDEIPAKFHLLNTNKGHDINDHNDMLNNRLAAAYHDCKFTISHIKKEDTVFLYENGVGIVAIGKGTGEVLKKDHYSHKNECHYQELNEFRKLKHPLKAAEVKRVLGRNVVFLRVRSSVPDGQKILNAISEK